MVGTLDPVSRSSVNPSNNAFQASRDTYEAERAFWQSLRLKLFE